MFIFLYNGVLHYFLNSMLINHGFLECFGKVESGIAMGFRWIPSVIPVGFWILDWNVISDCTVGFRWIPGGFRILFRSGRIEGVRWDPSGIPDSV
jgi:hypothetical protein